MVRDGNARQRVTRTGRDGKGRPVVQGDKAGGGSARHQLYIERFILPILAAVVVALAFTNPMGFDWPARIIGIVVFFIAVLSSSLLRQE